MLFFSGYRGLSRYTSLKLKMPYCTPCFSLGGVSETSCENPAHLQKLVADVLIFAGHFCQQNGPAEVQCEFFIPNSGVNFSM